MSQLHARSTDQLRRQPQKPILLIRPHYAQLLQRGVRYIHETTNAKNHISATHVWMRLSRCEAHPEPNTRKHDECMLLRGAVPACGSLCPSSWSNAILFDASKLWATLSWSALGPGAQPFLKSGGCDPFSLGEFGSRGPGTSGFGPCRADGQCPMSRQPGTYLPYILTHLNWSCLPTASSVPAAMTRPSIMTVDCTTGLPSATCHHPPPPAPSTLSDG